ncbi:MAG: flagellar export chaperone FliS [Clostridium sp.]
MYNNGYNMYKNNSVTHASREQLLLMLVDGAVKFAKLGREGILRGDVKLTHESFIRVQDIFTELIVTLDKNVGEWTTSLTKVYAFIKDSVMEANFTKKIEDIDKVIPLIEEVRDMWYEVDRKARLSK